MSGTRNKAATVPGVTKAGNIVMIDPAKIRIVENYNIRADFDPINDGADMELVLSLLTNGYRGAPIIVRIVGGDIDLVSGHRRVSAIRKINADSVAAGKGIVFKSIPAMTEDSGTDDATRTLDLILSNTGKQFDAAEKGAVYLRLKKFGWSNPQIAERAGVTVKWVSECQRLAQADKRLVALVRAKVISATLAVETLAKHGDATVAIVEEAAKQGTGANAGKATGKTIEAVTGKAAKNTRRGTAPAPASNEKTEDKPAAKPAKETRDPSLGSLAIGPFTLGKGMNSATLYNGAGTVLAELPDDDTARDVLKYLLQGWQTFKGKSPEVLAATDAKIAAGVSAPTVANDPAPVKAAAANTQRAPRKRVAR